MTKKTLEVINVFIGSPRDLAPERRFFKEAIDRVNEIKAKGMGLRLEPLAWEDTIPGKGPPQSIINKEVERANLCVFLFWKRWGTKQGKKKLTGTQEEFKLAEKENKQIWLYFKSVPSDQMADAGPQLSKVIKFRKKIEKENQYFVQHFDDAETWKETLIRHLCGELDKEPEERFTPIKENQDTTPPLPEGLAVAELTAENKKLKEKLDQLEMEKASKERLTAYRLAMRARELADDGQITHAQQLFAEAEESSPEPFVINYHALFLKELGLLQKAEEKLESMRIMGKKYQDKDLLAMALGNLGLVFLAWGELDRAEQAHSKALEIDREQGDKEGVAAQYVNLGLVSKTRGVLDRAEEMLNKSFEIYRKLGNKAGMAGCYSNFGVLHLTRGELNGAEEEHKKAFKIYRKLDHKIGMSIQYANLGLIYITWGELERAEEALGKAFEINRKLGRKGAMSVHYTNLGLIYRGRRELDLAENAQRKALEMNREMGRKEGIGINLINLGDIELDQEKLHQAEGNLEEALKLAKEVSSLVLTGYIHRSLGRLRRKQSRFEDAECELVRALELHQQIGCKEGQAETLLQMGILSDKKGNTSSAREKMEEALALFRGIGMKLRIEKTERRLKELENSASDDP